MAITNGYATLAALKAAIGITDTTDDVALEAAVEAASRQIDSHCGRRFWQDGTVVARTYRPSERTVAWVDDISTTTGLVVKADDNDDGTFETTLTINTDFVVEPVNAAAEYPVRPFTRLRLLGTGSRPTFTRLTSGRPYLQVTAKFGWPAVPDAVERAAVFQAKAIFKAADSAFGAYQLAVDGLPQRVPALHPTARALLAGLIRHDEVD